MRELGRRVRGGLATGLLVHLVGAGLAAVLSACVAWPLDRAGAAPPSVRDALEVVGHARLWPWQSSAMLAAVVGTLLLLQPALHLGWLRALGSGEAPGASLGYGARHYGRALALGLIAGGALALGLLPWLWLGERVWQGLGAEPESTRLGWTAAAGVVPALLWCGATSAWRDVAAAQLARSGRLRARPTLRAWAVVARPGVTASWLAWSLAGLGACALAPWLTWHIGGLGGVVLAQCALLSRTLLRSGWLAQATLLAERSATR